MTRHCHNSLWTEVSAVFAHRYHKDGITVFVYRVKGGWRRVHGAVHPTVGAAKRDAEKQAAALARLRNALPKVQHGPKLLS